MSNAIKSKLSKKSDYNKNRENTGGFWIAEKAPEEWEGDSDYVGRNRKKSYFA